MDEILQISNFSAEEIQKIVNDNKRLERESLYEKAIETAMAMKYGSRMFNPDCRDYLNYLNLITRGYI